MEQPGLAIQSYEWWDHTRPHIHRENTNFFVISCNAVTGTILHMYCEIKVRRILSYLFTYTSDDSRNENAVLHKK